ncbi:MAG: hypothetical protein ABIR06_02435 [Cyclobacteriaceae bacterium]
MIRSMVFLFAFLFQSAGINREQVFERRPIETNHAATPILWTIDFSADGKFYAIGGDDGFLRLYTPQKHKLINSYKLPGAVQCLDWSSDSKILAIAIDDRPVQLLTIATLKFQEIKGVTGSRTLAWNYNSELLAIGDYSGTLQIINREGELIKSIKKGSNKTYLSLDWHPKRNIILTGSDKIRLFDTSGNILKTIKHRSEETPILTVRWHPGGHFFATGDYGETENNIESLLQFWNEDGTLIKSLLGSQAEYRNIRWNKSGELLATASDELRIWSKDGKVIYSGKSDNLLWGIDWNSTNNSIITTSQKGNINLWSSEAKLVMNIFNY